jgi:hypothetical protein
MFMKKENNSSRISKDRKNGVLIRHLMYALFRDIADMVQIRRLSSFNISTTLLNPILKYILLMGFHILIHNSNNISKPLLIKIKIF